jgi:hypothetical protein
LIEFATAAASMMAPSTMASAGTGSMPNAVHEVLGLSA